MYIKSSLDGMTLYTSNNRREYRLRKWRGSPIWLVAHIVMFTAILGIVGLCAHRAAPKFISLLAAVSIAPIAAVHFV